MDYDVIVVGGGAAGLAAANSAAENGASVLIAEAGRKLGGSLALSGGVFYACCTSVQKQRGFEDSPEAMTSYILTLNQYKMDPAMVDVLSRKSGETLEWLIGLGVRFPPENLYVAGLDGALRGHRAAGRGAEIAEVLEGRLSGLANIDTAVNTRVRQLAFDPAHGVTGIVLDGEVVRARAVVLASGGFSANPEKVARLFPSASGFGDWYGYIGVSTNVGDGIDIGEAIGATITGHDRGAVLLTPNFSKDIEPYWPAWPIFVDREGNRFIDESKDYSVSPGAVLALRERECFAVFDEESRLLSRTNVASTDAKRVYAYSSWSAERIAEMVEAGKVATADTLEQLGVEIGVNGAALAATAARLNESYDRDGTDRQFFKDPSFVRPVRTPPYYAVRLRPAVIGTTHVGVKCLPGTEVLGRDGLPIPGLYAAGETVGNVLGERYAGGGNSIANSVTFGRIAGAGAAAHAKAVKAARENA